VIFLAIDIALAFFNLHKTREGVFWGVLGIQCTVVVGVLLFLMQMKSDRRINEIIEKQNIRYIQAKSYLSNEIINKLEEFRQAHIDLLPFVQDFESRKNDPEYLIQLRTLVLMNNFKVKINFIPTITENVNLIMDKLDDVKLGLEVRGSLDSLSGLIVVMATDCTEKNDPYCGLAGLLPPVNKINIINGNISQLEDLIRRMKKEKPTESL
jgi:hypothetical protein